jgi:hypothetical protein
VIGPRWQPSIVVLEHDSVGKGKNLRNQTCECDSSL